MKKTAPPTASYFAGSEIHDNPRLGFAWLLDAVLEKVTQTYELPKWWVQHDHVNPIVESTKKIKNTKKSKYSCAILIPNIFVQIFFFDCPAPQNTNSSELRSFKPSNRTTSPGTGGRPRNSWRNHGQPWQPWWWKVGVGSLVKLC